MAGEKLTKKEHVEPEEVKNSPEEVANYINLPVPHLTVASFTSPKGLLILVLISYLLSGLLYLKIRSLEGGGTVTATGGNQTIVSTNASTVNDAFLDFAKSAKLDTQKFASCLSSHKYAAKITTDVNDGTTAGINATPGFIVNGNVVVGAQPYSTFKTIIDQELAGIRSNHDFAFIPTAFAQSAPLTTQKVTVNDGHLPVLGKKSAKVTIVEFSDFQCPFCKQFFTDTLPQIKKDYIDTGKVKLFYRQYPLTSIHPNAQIAAEAAECANEQGKFWEFHDILFTNQSSWATLPQKGS